MHQILTDQVGRNVILPEIPERIVSLVPSQTELLYDLGLENKIMGITKFCVHPKHLKSNKKIVGGTKNINIKSVTQLNPDLIICNKEENTIEIVEALQKLAPVWVTDIKSLRDNYDMISAFGKICGIKEAADNLISQISAAESDFRSFSSAQLLKRALYLIWQNPYMAAGGDTFINEMMQIGNFENVLQNTTRYPEIELEKLIETRNPEIIFLSSEPFPFKEKHVRELRERFPTVQLILVDGEMFSWFGSRTLKAFNYLKKLRQN